MKRSKSPFEWKKITESMLFFPLIALSLILLFDLFFIPGFFHLEIKQGHLYGNLIDVLRNSAPTIMLAMGMTLVIATGGIDLSVGAVMAIAASTACILLNPNLIGLKLADVTREADPTYSASPSVGGILDSVGHRCDLRPMERVAGGVWKNSGHGGHLDPDDCRAGHRPTRYKCNQDHHLQ